jgi:hypothetical protein
VIHLVEHHLEIDRRLSHDESAEMLLDEIGRRHAAGCHGEADRAILRLDLDQDRAEYVDPEGAPGRLVGGVLAHRRGDDRAVDPMAVRFGVVVGALIGAGLNQGAEVDNRLHRAVRNEGRLGG